MCCGVLIYHICGIFAGILTYQETMAASKTYRYRVLFIVCLSAALGPFMGFSINLALPHIAKDFALSGVTQNWVVTTFLLSSAIFQIPFGRLADIWGKRTVFTAGLVVFTLSSLGCCLPFNTGTALLVFRTLQGISSAMIFSTNMAILTLVFPAKELGRAMGINAAVTYTALALGPLFGGFIITHVGWEGVFGLIAALSLIACIGSFFVLKKRWATAKGEPFDAQGAVLYGMALCALIYGFSSLPLWWGYALIAGGAVLMVLFVWYEKGKRFPVFNVSLFFKNRSFSFSSTAALLSYVATFPISVFISIYLQDIRGFNADYAGLILVAYPVIQVVLSPVAGRLSDRIPPRYLASFGLVVVATALLLTAFITPTTPVWYVFALLLLMGGGFAAFVAPNNKAIMSSVSRQHYSMASAVTGTMRLTGQAFSMGIATMVFALYLGSRQISAEVSAAFMQAMQLAFIILAAVCAVGVYFSLARGKEKERV